MSRTETESSYLAYLYIVDRNQFGHAVITVALTHIFEISQQQQLYLKYIFLL